MTLICLTSVSGYVCFRDDRMHRLGGGVGIWIKHYRKPRRVVLPLKPMYVESVAVALKSNILLIGCYFPPDVAISKSKELTDFLINSIDDFLSSHPNYHVIICGDLNRYNFCNVCCHCNLVSMYVGATYGDSQLDSS